MKYVIRIVLAYGAACTAIVVVLYALQGNPLPAWQEFEAYLWEGWRGVVLLIIHASGPFAFLIGALFFAFADWP